MSSAFRNKTHNTDPAKIAQFENTTHATQHKKKSSYCSFGQLFELQTTLLIEPYSCRQVQQGMAFKYVALSSQLSERVPPQKQLEMHGLGLANELHTRRNWQSQFRFFGGGSPDMTRRVSSIRIFFRCILKKCVRFLFSPLTLSYVFVFFSSHLSPQPSSYGLMLHVPTTTRYPNLSIK